MDGLPADRGMGLRLRELDGQSQPQELVLIDVAAPAAIGYGVRRDLASHRALALRPMAHPLERQVPVEASEPMSQPPGRDLHPARVGQLCQDVLHV